MNYAQEEEIKKEDKMKVKLKEPNRMKNWRIEIDLSRCDLSKSDRIRIYKEILSFIKENREVFLQSNTNDFYMIEYWTDDVLYIKESFENFKSKLMEVK